MRVLQCWTRRTEDGIHVFPARNYSKAALCLLVSSPSPFLTVFTASDPTTDVAAALQPFAFQHIMYVDDKTSPRTEHRSHPACSALLTIKPSKCHLWKPANTTQREPPRHPTRPIPRSHCFAMLNPRRPRDGTGRPRWALATPEAIRPGCRARPLHCRTYELRHRLNPPTLFSSCPDRDQH